jgi:hypothetical protein
MDDETAVLLAIETLRSNPEYHAAEVLRRKTLGGSAAMAATTEGSAERSAVLLLIGTWESIAVLAEGLKKRDKIFEVTPICHMYRELKAGIDALRTFFGAPTYASNFEALDGAHRKWLEKYKKNGKYAGAVCGGLYARFG